MKNPVKLIQETSGAKSRVDFAKRTGIGYATLYSLQSGCPAKMSSRTAEQLAKHGQMSAIELQKQYRSWREQQQQQE